MAIRHYGQYGAIAKALDVLGDRWALLIVRELLFGALRYSDLQAALPGVATDMLATRLRELEVAGVIARAPDDAKRYELTPRGRDLRPVLEAIAVWVPRRVGRALLSQRPARGPPTGSTSEATAVTSTSSSTSSD